MLRLIVLLSIIVASANAFTAPSLGYATALQKQTLWRLAAEDDVTEGVVELGDEPEEVQVVAPFLSQGEIAEGVLNPDLSDPKQARVIIYIILSLIPVLFLVPLILGSRDFLPMEDLPAVIL